MRLHRLATLPFAMLADVASLGNIGGDRSFTGQVFDAEERERIMEHERKIFAMALAARIQSIRSEVREEPER